MAILPTTDPEKYKLSDIEALLKNIIDLALIIAGAIAVIYLVIGAYGYFTAFGNEEKAGKAKTTIVWAVIGVVVIILSKILIAEVWKMVTNTPVEFPT